MKKLRNKRMSKALRSEAYKETREMYHDLTKEMNDLTDGKDMKLFNEYEQGRYDIVKFFLDKFKFMIKDAEDVEIKR